ncbi:hypothetical protein [Pseudomonas viridiflava]|uniref:hypothetical protein n=2 Tax=Pseudomonas TaxID=286 RepID=UPI0013CE49CA|nr:hypothetical protein [Pseudomonas viridiflava]MBD8615122.1 hypothetical protein [Pseudomonas putida]
MGTGSEVWQSAFTQARLGNPEPLRSLVAQEVIWSDLHPLMSLMDHPALESGSSLESFFVLKNEYAHVAFGLDAPEVAAPLCFLVACHYKGLIDAGRLFGTGVPGDPEILVQLAMLPGSWGLALPAAAGVRLGQGLDIAAQELIASKLKGGDFFACLAVALQKRSVVHDAMKEGLCITDSASHCLTDGWGPLAGDSIEVGRDGLVHKLHNHHFESPLEFFLQICRVGVCTPHLLRTLHGAGLALNRLPVPMSCVQDAESFLACSLHHKAHGDQLAWIERTYLNVMGFFFAQGHDEALVALQQAEIDLTLKTAVINAWGAYRPSSLALLSPIYLDNNLGADLGL